MLTPIPLDVDVGNIDIISQCRRRNVGNYEPWHRHEGERGKVDPRSEAFLQKLLNLEAAENVTNDSRNDIIGVNVAAGSDITAVTLSVAFYYLDKSPEKMTKLCEEISTAEKEG
ncbi:uncharacterized protein Z518_08921 [Rhinocladiella mackenziei CBS 650.93]|uniref:Rhinocladiella mackenziei CBS 650.93 unplaced genomic scaffold supercont1.7, whole genome shotgun sequence n=1 Tax=Rhinocladiella mackenziei CBS 650.93 TaxID=1442369 RepID=A0A0D2ID93_9EURO|nr:uncharacterized protein Z518_08921 [Rhinocladiella mackenziei CBS 650.93]KIX01196.1 hypothetical protein Z518_08921 [Rhinocladiella mackenziei CBS 650.93]